MHFPFPWCYVMAAKGIQPFILQGDKLRLMIGGSELIDGLPGDWLVLYLLSDLALHDNGQPERRQPPACCSASPLSPATICQS